jgi:signal recognition particle receptor subunit beta
MEISRERVIACVGIISAVIAIIALATTGERTIIAQGCSQLLLIIMSVSVLSLSKNQVEQKSVEK